MRTATPYLFIPSGCTVSYQGCLNPLHGVGNLILQPVRHDFDDRDREDPNLARSTSALRLCLHGGVFWRDLQARLPLPGLVVRILSPR